MTRETVIADTPALRATSRTVAFKTGRPIAMTSFATDFLALEGGWAGADGSF
jgi:hypothetical protein